MFSWRSFREGMDSSMGLDFDEISQTHKAINATCRSGRWRQRPGFVCLRLNFDSPKTRSLFQKGRFQGAFYHTANRAEVMICVLSGNILWIDISSKQVAQFPNPQNGPWLSPNVRQVWGARHECANRRYLIINDGLNAPVVIDQSLNIRYTDPFANPPEIPTGSIITSCQRLLSWFDPSRSFIFHGDRYAATSPAQDLTNQVSTYFLGDGAHSSTSNLGKGTGMVAMPVLDTGSGIGALLVAFERGWITIDLAIARNLWPTINRDIVRTITVGGIGNKSPSAIAQVNTDIYFWHSDGLRSLRAARQDLSRSSTSIPLSRPVQIWLDQYATDWDMNNTMLFNRRLYNGATPFRRQGTDHLQQPITRFLHRGFLVCDFFNMDRNEAGYPIWDGLWTGITPEGGYSLVEGIFDGLDRGFVFARTDDDRMNLYEIREDIPYDTIEIEGRNFRKRIHWSIETKARSLNKFSADGTQSTIQILDGSLEVGNVHGRLDVSVEFSPDIYPEWFRWRELSVCAKMENCDESRLVSCENAPQPFNPRPQNYVNRMLGRPEDNDKCLQHTYRKADNSNRFRFRLSFIGAAELNSFNVVVGQTSRAERFTCEAQDCRVIDYCEDSDYSYDLWNATQLYEH